MKFSVGCPLNDFVIKSAEWYMISHFHLCFQAMSDMTRDFSLDGFTSGLRNDGALTRAQTAEVIHSRS